MLTVGCDMHDSYVHLQETQTILVTYNLGCSQYHAFLILGLFKIVITTLEKSKLFIIKYIFFKI